MPSSEEGTFVRRLITRLVLLGALAGALVLGANSTLNHPRTADTWPNPLVTNTGPSTDPVVTDTGSSTDPLVVTSDPWPNPLVVTSDPWPNPLTVDGAPLVSDSVVEGV
jgi:hypothetical protein